MVSSNLSLLTWFTAHLSMSATKKGFSFLEFQRQFGLKRYETSFNLMHKLKSVMGKRDNLYFLKCLVEYNEAYVRKATQHEVQKHLKRGKGSQNHTIVAVASESTLLEDPDSGIKSRYCEFFNMRVIQEVTKKIGRAVCDRVSNSKIGPFYLLKHYSLQFSNTFRKTYEG